MKIGFFTGIFPSLSETFILNQITGLIDLGQNVEIFAFKRPGDKKVHSDVSKYSLIFKTHYCDMPDNKILRILKALKILILNFYKRNFVLIKALSSNYGKGASSLRLFYLSFAFIDKKIDVLQCHYGFNGLLGVYLKELGLVKSVITAFHAYDLSEYMIKFGDKAYQDLFLMGDLFLPISEYWKRKLLILRCNENKTVVHHMGINLDRFKLIQKQKNQSEPIQLLSVGRLCEKKGIEYAIRAVAESIKGGKNIFYTIAGDGPLRFALEKIARDEKIEANVKFLGVCSQDEIVSLFSKTDIFILPSITTKDGDQEGIPVVLMEASASGIPVVSTKHSGIPEIIIDEESGLLAREKDILDLSEKINTLIDNSQKWIEFGMRGREIVETNFNIKTLNEKLLAHFKRVLSRGN